MKAKRIGLGAVVLMLGSFMLHNVAADSRASARSTRYQDAAGYAEALREHERTGKPMALYFYVDWCKYCAQLERGILSRSEVKQYLETILYVSVNPEHGKGEEALFEKFEGRGYPDISYPRQKPTCTGNLNFCAARSFSPGMQRGRSRWRTLISLSRSSLDVMKSS